MAGAPARKVSTTKTLTKERQKTLVLRAKATQKHVLKELSTDMKQMKTDVEKNSQDGQDFTVLKDSLISFQQNVLGELEKMKEELKSHAPVQPNPEAAWKQHMQQAETAWKQHMQEAETARTQYEQEAEAARKQHMQQAEAARKQHMQQTETARKQHMQQSEKAWKQHMQEAETARKQHMQEAETAWTQYEQEAETAQKQYEQEAEAAQKQHEQDMEDYREYVATGMQIVNAFMETATGAVKNLKKFFEDLWMLIKKGDKTVDEKIKDFTTKVEQDIKKALEPILEVNINMNN